MKAILEGLLFVVGEDGLSLKQINDLLEIDESISLELIEELKNDYIDNNRGLNLEYLGDRYKLTTKKEHKEYYKKLLIEEHDKELSKACLETLAIIAYNEPISRGEIDEIRGVYSAHLIRKLILRELVEEVGRADTPGRPILYGITNTFLDYFGLKTKEELPKIEIEEVKKEQIDLFTSKYNEIEDDKNE